MGLPEGHAEKEGVEVELAQLVTELETRLKQKRTSSVTTLKQQLEGMHV